MDSGWASPPPAPAARAPCWRGAHSRVNLPESRLRQRHRMDDMVTIEIQVSSEAAAALADAERRAALGRYVSRMLHGAKARDLLAEAIADAKAEARAAGLTDADIDAELAAYNAERRD